MRIKELIRGEVCMGTFGLVEIVLQEFDTEIEELKGGSLKKDEFTKEGALEYLMKNSVYGDERSGAGMYHAVEEVIKSDKKVFEKDVLDTLLRNARNF